MSVVMVTTKRQNMASLLSEILFETAGQGPPPSKDFYQFVITQKEVFRSTLNEDSSGIIIRDKYLNVVVNFCITCIAKNNCLSYLISKMDCDVKYLVISYNNITKIPVFTHFIFLQLEFLLVILGIMFPNP